MFWHFTGMYFWRVLAKQNESRLADSEGSANLRGDYFALERLRLVRIYFSGRWHTPRHIILSVLVVVLAFFATPNPGANLLVDGFLSRLLGVNNEMAKVYVITGLFLLYATIGEGWTWLQRIVTRISLHAIDGMERRYRRPVPARRARVNPSVQRKTGKTAKIVPVTH